MEPSEAVKRLRAKEARLAAKAAAQDAAGIPDSKPFGGVDDENDPILLCHVGGVLVKDMLAALTPATAALMRSGLSYHATDEGIAKNNEGKTGTGAAVVADQFDQSVRHKRDDLRNPDIPNPMAHDPLKELVKKHIKPGMRGKLLSKNRMQENGGPGDYQIVKHEGEPVKYKGMVLGEIPEEQAQARNRFYQGRSNALMKQITETYKAEGGATAVTDQ